MALPLRQISLQWAAGVEFLVRVTGRLMWKLLLKPERLSVRC